MQNAFSSINYLQTNYNQLLVFSFSSCIASFTASYALTTLPLEDKVANFTILFSSPGKLTSLLIVFPDVVIIWMSCSGVNDGKYDLSKAATPATTGLAKLVPSAPLYRLSVAVE